MDILWERDVGKVLDVFMERIDEVRKLLGFG